MASQATAYTTPGVAPKKHDLTQWVPVYAAAVAAFGIAIIILAFHQPMADPLGLALFALIAAGVELSSVELFNSSRSRVSISAVIAMAGIVTFGPFAGALIHAASGVMTAITTSLFQEQKPETGRASWLQRLTFNIGMWVAATSSAGYVYTLAGGTSGTMVSLSTIIPLIAAALVDIAVNLTLLTGIITLQTGRSPTAIWQQDLRWGVPINFVAAVVGGGVLAIAYQVLGILGLAIFLLPILSIGYSFRLYVAHMRDYVNRLEVANASLDEANVGLLETMGAVVDAYDAYTYGHSRQVALYAETLAQAVGLPEAERLRIVKAALVHDLGKVGIMDSIIGKQARLTDEEYNMVKRHPAIGAEIVGRMKALQELVPLVRGHHERWDGKGYPDGLKGETIPLGARILSVADSLDAMCSDRPYRPTRSFLEIKEEMARCAGTQFDPAIVKALEGIMATKEREFFRNSASTVDQALAPSASGGLEMASRYLKKAMITPLRRAS